MVGGGGGGGGGLAGPQGAHEAPALEEGDVEVAAKGPGAARPLEEVAEGQRLEAAVAAEGKGGIEGGDGDADGGGRGGEVALACRMSGRRRRRSERRPRETCSGSAGRGATGISSWTRASGGFAGEDGKGVDVLVDAGDERRKLSLCGGELALDGEEVEVVGVAGLDALLDDVLALLEEMDIFFDEERLALGAAELDVVAWRSRRRRR